jgi:HD-GYP domain-containing protein (c-di-GMP phosphodiesterase class II)
MSSNRSYRPALSRAQVFHEIRTGNGKQFDPSLVGTFLTMDFAEFDRALRAHARAEHRAA